MYVVGTLGFDGALGHIIEYAGTTVRNLEMPGRFTLCNMSVEAGARAGLIAPDEKTFDYIHGRPHAPTGQQWHQALACWAQLRSDEGAVFDREINIDAAQIPPLVTWGTSPEDTVPVNSRVPDPQSESDPDRRRQLQRKLDYMGLQANTPVTDIRIDQVFIGSCTNGRLADLEAAAAIVKNRKVVVPSLVVPATQNIQREAEALGLDQVFLNAGFVWGAPGCSMCCGQNGEILKPGQRSASTINRNFEGRQGPGVRTHLMSPAMAAASAVSGRISDVRTLSNRAN